MRQRCNNPNDPSYSKYGGRGIRVCDQWQNSFETFLADMGERPESCSIERDDVDGNYEPGNCRWATATEQQGNRRITQFVTVDGVTKPLTEWAREVGMKRPQTIIERLRQGWPSDKAVFTPSRKKRAGS